MFDWTFVTHYAPFFVNGAAMTLFISVFGIVLSIVVGLICAGIEIARIPVLKQIVRVYIELSRNTPLLVQLYFLYFGLPKLGVVWSAEQCAIVGLGFLGGSYMAEAMRGGLETIPNVQRESAYVLGLSQWQTLSRVVIPQAIGTSIPGIVANVIFLIKESSVVSAIALADVMYMAKDLIGMYYSTYESLLMLVVAYLVILLRISFASCRNWRCCSSRFTVSPVRGIGIWMRPAHACSCSCCGAARNWAIWCVARLSRFRKPSMSPRMCLG